MDEKDLKGFRKTASRFAMEAARQGIDIEETMRSIKEFVNWVSNNLIIQLAIKNEKYLLNLLDKRIKELSEEKNNV